MSDELGVSPTIYIPKKNVVMDATVLTALMNCPRFADLRFNHNLVSIGGKSNSLECGSIVHKYLETFYKCRIGGLKLDESFSIGYAAAQLYIAGCRHCTDFVPHACDCLHPVGEENSQILEANPQCDKCKGTGMISKPTCGHPPNEYPGVKNTPAEPAADKAWQVGWRWVLDTIEQYYNFWRNDSWVPLEVEVVKSKILYEDDDLRVLWKAKLDWVVDTDKGIVAVDHKSMKQNRNQTKLNNQFIGQNLIMGTRTMYLNKVGFQKTLPPEKKFMRQGMSYEADALLEWQSQTLPFYARMLLAYVEMGYFPPNYSNCQSKFGDCAFIGACEGNRDMREKWLKDNFLIGPAWNPSNENSDED